MTHARTAVRGRSSAALAVLLATIATAVPAPVASADPVLSPAECAWPIRTDATMANYAFPDTHATYFIRPVWLRPGDELEIRGVEPDAVYWSLQTYRFRDGSWMDGVNDADVRRSADGSWTAYVRTTDDPADPNVLVSPTQGSQPPDLDDLGIVIYRVYSPASGGASGGPLPTIASRSASGSERVLDPCAADEVGPPVNKPALTPIADATTVFMRGPASTVYPSADTAYLGAQAPYRKGKVLVVTGRAPRVPAQVRYWSLCQNVNAGLLPVVDCVDSREVPRRRGGTYTVAVVAPGQVSTRQQRRMDRVAFVDWTTASTPGPLADAFLIYRTLLPVGGFRKAVQDVPDGGAGRRHIGEYAPRLRYVPVREFLREWR